MNNLSADKTIMPILVLGGTGKTGRRVAAGLEARGLPVRIGARSAIPAFDWTDQTTWAAALDGASAAYIAYSPDLAVPGAVATIETFIGRAVASGVRRLVLLSGRGEEEAQLCEAALQASGAEWTILRASWFNQNFSEGAFIDGVLAGEMVLPASNVAEPFVDADDIADAAVAAFTEPGHVGRLYELTGPDLLTFAEATAIIAAAVGREIRHVQVPVEDYVAAVAAQNLPADIVWLVGYLFSTVLDGRNARLADGVLQALGRPPRRFGDYARETAASGVWDA